LPNTFDRGYFNRAEEKQRRKLCREQQIRIMELEKAMQIWSNSRLYVKENGTIIVRVEAKEASFLILLELSLPLTMNLYGSDGDYINC